MQSKLFSTNKTLSIGGKLMDLSVPKVMGILNVTTDSFYAGSRYNDTAHILKRAEEMLEEGADFIDIGGYSSRPGATDITVEEELARVIPAIQAIIKVFPRAILSIDTFRARVARQAVEEGALIINDISAGGLDAEMFNTVAELQVPYIIMHMKGTPQVMKQLTDYDNLIKEIADYFHQKIFALERLGVKDIIVDPGFGFAKTIEQNFELLSNLSYFGILGKPILAGLSRKSMIWKTLNIKPEDALNGTTALNTIALQQGAGILRVHDVREAVQVIRLLGHI